MAAAAQTDSQTLSRLQGSTGGPLGATGGQQAGITLPTSCGLRIPHTPSPGQAHAASQYSSAVGSYAAQEEFVPSEPARLCSFRAAF